jgi:hypothetical protein
MRNHGIFRGGGGEHTGQSLRHGTLGTKVTVHDGFTHRRDAPITNESLAMVPVSAYTVTDELFANGTGIPSKVTASVSTAFANFLLGSIVPAATDCTYRHPQAGTLPAIFDNRSAILVYKSWRSLYFKISSRSVRSSKRVSLVNGALIVFSDMFLTPSDAIRDRV